MKVNPSDTPDMAAGKLESLMMMNRLIGQRAELTSNIMNQLNIPKSQAALMAEKQLNVPFIKRSIQLRIKGITPENIKHTMKVNNMSKEEVMAALRKKGIINAD